MGRSKNTRDTRYRKKEVKQLNRIYKRDMATCWLCVFFNKTPVRSYVAREDASRDHITARANGGSDADINIRLAHKRCNSTKGTLSISELFCITSEEWDTMINVTDDTLDECTP